MIKGPPQQRSAGQVETGSSSGHKTRADRTKAQNLEGKREEEFPLSGKMQSLTSVKE